MLRLNAILTISLLISVSAFAQKKAPYSLIKKGEELYLDNKSDEIYKLGKRFVEHYKGDPKTQFLVCVAADVALTRRDTLWAENAYLLVLATDDSKMEKDETNFPEGYSLVKGQACSHLIDLYLGQKQYTKALKYLELSETTYRPFYFCGNGVGALEAMKAFDFATCYDALGKTDSAINRLWPFTFDYHLKGSDPSVAEKMTQLLKNKYTGKQVSDELQRAEHTILVSKNNNQYTPTIIIFGNKIEMPLIENYQMKKYNVDDEQNVSQLTKAYKELYRSTEFYKSFVH